MSDSRFIQSLSIKNLLSFGSERVEVDLKPLNIIIGLNGSGKSNLIEAISLLQAAPRDLNTPFTTGSIDDWLWKGVKDTPTAEIDVVLASFTNGSYSNFPLRYRLNFTATNHQITIVDEAVEDAQKRDATKSEIYFYYRYQNGRPVANIKVEQDYNAKRTLRNLQATIEDSKSSVLTRRQDADLYPEITQLSEKLVTMRLYRRWCFEPDQSPRSAQPISLKDDFLQENLANLAGVLNKLQDDREVFRTIEANLKKFYPTSTHLYFRNTTTTQEFLVEEEGLVRGVPASRLSEGTLRYLCLLAILCHPVLPPLICLEEPEAGMHPDQMSVLADLIIEASKRTQLIITTQSDMFLSSFSDFPEVSSSLIVCERDENGSHLYRPNAAKIAKGLEEDSLGGLWMRGLLGGVR